MTEQRKCYAVRMRGQPEDDPTRVTFVPSGFKGAWIMVYEDVDYSLSVRYATDDDTQQLRAAVAQRGEKID